MRFVRPFFNDSQVKKEEIHSNCGDDDDDDDKEKDQEDEERMRKDVMMTRYTNIRKVVCMSLTIFRLMHLISNAHRLTR